jgi:hypothetical protein
LTLCFRGPPSSGSIRNPDDPTMTFSSSSFLRLASAAVMSLAAAGLTSCGAPTYLVDVQVNPSTAAVYVDGVSKGQGSKPVRVTFDGNRRVFVHVVEPYHRPFCSHYTLDEIRELVSSRRGISVTLRPY